MRARLVLMCAATMLFPAIGHAQVPPGAIAEYFRVDRVRVDADGRGYVRFMSDLVGTPAACGATAHPRELAFDTRSASGRSILSLVLTAKSTDREVYARGSNACLNYTTVEDWLYGWLR